MGIFGRRREAPVEQDEPGGRAATAQPADPDAAGADADLRAGGPFDSSEMTGPGDRLDLGSMWVPAVEGMAVRLEVDEASQVVTTVHVGLGESQLALSAFAAPRTTGVWPEIRAEIAESIAAQQGTAQIVDGPLGREIVADLPGGGPHARFLGVDGPRWFLRGVLTGPAAQGSDADGPLLEILRGIVVVRGSAAMAPRELLPLRVPTVEASADPATTPPAGRPGRAEDLRPFDRGPEITEVR